MSMKQHELNILKNVLEKAEGISERLQKWAGDLTDFIKQEIAEEEAELAKLKAQSSIGADGALNPLVGGVGQALQGEGASTAETPAPAAPETGNVVQPDVAVTETVAPAQPVVASEVQPSTQPAEAVTGDASAAPSADAPSPSTAAE